MEFTNKKIRKLFALAMAGFLFLESPMQYTYAEEAVSDEIVLQEEPEQSEAASTLEEVELESYVADPVLEEVKPELYAAAPVLEEEEPEPLVLEAPVFIFTQQTPDGVILRWDEVENAQEYELYRDGELLQTWQAGDLLEYEDSDLAPEAGATYVYKLVAKAVDESITSENSLELSWDNILQALKKVDVTVVPVSYKMMKLTWDKREGAAGYRIYRKSGEDDFQLLKIISSGDILEYKDTGLVLGCTYEYIVRPYLQINGTVYEGEKSDAIAQKTTLGMVANPSAVSSRYDTMKVTWKAVSGATGYEIYRSDSEDGAYFSVGTKTGSGTLSFSNSGLELEKTYYYKIRAYRLVNGERIYSDYSEMVSGTTHLSKVTGLTASAVDYQTIKLTWDKVGAQKYQIYYSLTGGNDYRYLTSVTGNSYQMKATCGQKYYFKVRAVSATDSKTYYGEYSSVAEKMTTISTPQLSLTSCKYNSITIGWKAVAGAEEYEIYCKGPEDEDYILLDSTGKTSYTHTGLALEKTYSYKVSAKRQLYTTSKSNSVTGTTKLGTLGGFTGKRSGTKITLSWTKVEGVTTYEVYRSTSKDSGYKVIATVTSGNSYTDKDLKKATTYYYKVRGVLDGHTTNYAGPLTFAGEYSKYGIDVSQHQGNISWSEVAGSGIGFAIIRAGFRGYGTGNLATDQKFLTNIKGALNADLKVGIYFYTQAISEAEAIEEANYVADLLEDNGYGGKITFPIYVDTEAAPGSVGRADNLTRTKRTKIINAFCKQIQKRGYQAGIYASKSWYEDNLYVSDLGDYEIWVAQYNTSCTYSGNYDMWQYSSKGSISGISGNVDLDVCYKKY